jgi:cell volume regulation protein A
MDEGILIAAFLIFIARPIAVMISLAFAKDMDIRKKLFISWVGLRGAVPIVFATYPLLAGIDYDKTLFNLVFFISASSVLLQGTTLPFMARWLGVIVPDKTKKPLPFEVEIKEKDHGELVKLDLPFNSELIGKQITQLSFPENVMIVLICRNNKYFPPNGETVLQTGDRLLIMADNKKASHEVYGSIGVKQT